MADRFVDRTGGSKWLSALPIGSSQCVQAQPAGGEWLSAPPTRLRYRGKMLQPQAQCSTARNAAPAAAAKGTRGACDCSPRPPWNPLPLQTRSRGCVLRWIRSSPASFW